MPRHIKFNDPLGPGMPAWKNFDRALAAWIAGDNRRYSNARDQMLRAVRSHHHGNPTAWAESLTQAIIEATGHRPKQGPKAK